MKRTVNVRSLLLICGMFLLGHAQSLGQAQKSGPPAESKSAQSRTARWELWKSETSGKEYRVSVEKDRFRAEWANLPAEAIKLGSYIRTECHPVGSKWLGTSSIYLACAAGQGPKEHTANRCHLTMRFEVDSISAGRITGRVENPKAFDCTKCTVPETEWRSFVWVPKR